MDPAVPLLIFLSFILGVAVTLICQKNGSNLNRAQTARHAANAEHTRHTRQPFLPSEV